MNTLLWLGLWFTAGMALASLYSAFRANVRADEAYELAAAGMAGHVHVADVLAEHHERLDFGGFPKIKPFEEEATETTGMEGWPQA